MRREASIPLFLWAATAALAHLLWGGGADQGARLIDERLDVGRFAAGVRSHVRGSIAPPIEIALEDESVPEEAASKPPESPAKDEPDPDEEDEQNPDAAKDEPNPKRRQEPKPTEQQEPELEAKPAEPPKPEPPKPEAAAEPLKEIPELELPKRIAVKQAVDDPHQKDNPEARYIADKANHVAEETRARVTSTTGSEERSPTPGTTQAGPKEAPGNAEETHVRQDADEAGERGRAPGGADSAKAERAVAVAPTAQGGDAGKAAPGKNSTSTSERSSPTSAQAEQKEQTARAATPASNGMPEVVASQDGSFSIKSPEAATPEKKARKAKKRLPPRRPKSLMEALGLGSAGRTGTGVALNLTPSQAVDAIGSDELSRLRRTDGERRRSQHRGSWRVPNFERYRSAIENYVPSIKPGNQTALNTAAAPFASYLNQVHSRIHPIFADEFLMSLEQLPASHPLNDLTLVTTMEIVLEREEGRLVRRGVVKNSGVTSFDVQALMAVDRAGPFGTPPTQIISPDGNVYLHWEFRRDQMACSTLYAHPFIKRTEPKPAPLPTTPRQPPFRGPDDAAPPDRQRHGLAPGASARPAPPG
ncbi:MAG TPA: hypothetical protein VJN18_09090 [Polyangiaceae bacterium]|nr:hypothetical protein [Polyangiaceae bacterium]